MPVEASVALAVFFTYLGVYSSNPMFPRHNRPVVFRGTAGEALFGVVTLIILALGF